MVRDFPTSNRFEESLHIRGFGTVYRPHFARTRWGRGGRYFTLPGVSFLLVLLPSESRLVETAIGQFVDDRQLLGQCVAVSRWNASYTP